MEFRSGVTENSRKTSGETPQPQRSAGCRKANTGGFKRKIRVLTCWEHSETSQRWLHGQEVMAMGSATQKGW